MKDKRERITKVMDELAIQHQRGLISNQELLNRVLDELIREGGQYEHVAATLAIVLVDDTNHVTAREQVNRWIDHGHTSAWIIDELLSLYPNEFSCADQAMRFVTSVIDDRCKGYRKAYN